MSTEIISEDALTEFCQRWNIQELALFGSILREDFGASSDVDVLVAFGNNAQWGLLEHVQMENELRQLLGREVDLVSKRAIEQSQNWIRREEILDSARTVYCADEITHVSR